MAIQESSRWSNNPPTPKSLSALLPIASHSKKTKMDPEGWGEICEPVFVANVILFYQCSEDNNQEMYEAEHWDYHPLYKVHNCAPHCGYDVGIIILTKESSKRWRQRHNGDWARGMRPEPLVDVGKKHKNIK